MSVVVMVPIFADPCTSRVWAGASVPIPTLDVVVFHEKVCGPNFYVRDRVEGFRIVIKVNGSCGIRTRHDRYLIDVEAIRVNVPARYPAVGIIDIQVRITSVHIYYLGRFFK